MLACGLIADIAGTVFFSAWDLGYQLWRSDGTETGTVLVKGFGGPFGYPRSITDVGGAPFFVADEGTHGLELWTSDGTEAGTVLVKDINPGGGSDPDDLSRNNGRLPDGTIFRQSEACLSISRWSSQGGWRT